VKSWCGADIPPVPTDVVVTDNCDSNPELIVTETQSGTDCPYTVTRTFTAQDGCGNETVVIQTITVVTQIASSDPLLSAFPNPFSEGTTIEFVVPTQGYVLIAVYNNMGQMVDVIFEGQATPGIQYQRALNTTDYDNGMYYTRLLFEDKVLTEKMIKSN